MLSLLDFLSLRFSDLPHYTLYFSVDFWQLLLRGLYIRLKFEIHCTYIDT
jgi:hypothetical protein